MNVDRFSTYYLLQTGAAAPLLLAKGLLVALLLAWMAVSLSGLFWRLLPQPDLKPVEMSNNAAAFASAQSSSASSVDISSLKNIPLFGRAAEVASVVEVEPVKQEELEATKLNLELVGSFANENQKRAYAIIANGKKQELYRIEEEITGLSNVKLVSVSADKVIINNRGRQEALHMYPEGKPISSGVNVVSSQLGSAVPSTPAQGSSALATLNPNQRLEKISDAIRFSRKTQDGQMVGFRVLPGRNRAAFEQTGLQLNDVVTAIDGQSLDNLRAANQIYQEKRNATQASLTVLRGEVELTIYVDLNNINVN
ncbi:MAG: general secretion pathway protein C [Cellvibrionaceae bacterium]|jgi:general secretion pathway protein C